MKAEDILQRIKAAGLEIVGTPRVADGDDSERRLILEGIEGTEAQWQALLSPTLSAERVAKAAGGWQKAMDDWHACWHAYNALPAQKMTAEDEKRTLDGLGEAERALSEAVRQWLVQQQGGTDK